MIFLMTGSCLAVYVSCFVSEGDNGFVGFYWIRL